MLSCSGEIQATLYERVAGNFSKFQTLMVYGYFKI